MKMQLGAAVTVLLLLAACAPPKPAPAPTAATATGDQAQTAQAAPAPKKQRCSNGTGSRLGGSDCSGQGTSDSQENSSQAYQSGLAGNSMGRPK